MTMHIRASSITAGSAHALLTLVSKLGADLTRLHREVKEKSNVRGLVTNPDDAESLAKKYDARLARFLRDLEEMANVSHYTMNKLTHGDNVTTDVLERICKALDVTMDDIMEFVDE